MTANSAAEIASRNTDEHTYVRTSRPTRVSFQGELGAYGDQAIAQRWQGAAIPVPAVSFEKVVADVACGLTDCGIIPVWNTIVGDIVTGGAAVRVGVSGNNGLVVTGEADVEVRHQLLALPGTVVNEIDSVTSHPVALAQCGRFLAAHPKMLLSPAYDTAGSARDLALRRTRGSAAIAGREAAERYGLVVVHADIHDIPHNVTRFVILARANFQRNDLNGLQCDEPVRW